MIVYIHSYIHYIHCLEKASPSSYRLFRVISPNKKILIGESYSFGPCKNIARSFLFLYKYYIIIKMKDDLEQIEEETKRKAKEREKKKKPKMKVSGKSVFGLQRVMKRKKT